MASVLSIEDDPDFQHLVSYALRRNGMEVHYAFTGEEGVEKAQALNPDLVLLDMMLPVYNGPEVLKRLRASKVTRSTPVIVLTAYAGDADFLESQMRALGVVRYLRKPVQIEELLSTVKSLLNRHKTNPPVTLWKKGAFRIAAESRSLWIGRRLVANLAPKRFEVLFHLLQSDDEVPWRALVDKVWGKEGTKNDLEQTISRLREDLGDDAVRITTTRTGYRLTA